MTKLMVVGFIILLVVIMLLPKGCNRQVIRAAVRPEKVDQGVCIPEKDFAAWTKEYGREDQNQTQRRGVRDPGDVTSGIALLKDLIAAFPEICGGRSEQDVKMYLSQIEELLDCYDRAGREVLMKSIDQLDMVKSFREELARCSVGQERSIMIERYYRVVCQLADWWWIKAGREFESAEWDLSVYRVLKSISREKLNGQGNVEVLIERWKNDRCDSVHSNFCRAHYEGERMFNRYYADLIGNDERKLKAVSSWYRLYLESARSILGREPAWTDKGKNLQVDH